MCEATKDPADLALRRYDVIMRYLASDNAIYWTRSQLLLLAQTALLGFYGNQLKDLPEDLSHEPWYKLIFLMVNCLVGLALCGLWHFAIKGGQFWMDRWEAILTGLEQVAFGADIKVYREMTADKRPKPRTRAVARWTLVFFSILWAVALSLILYLVSYKCSG